MMLSLTLKVWTLLPLTKIVSHTSKEINSAVTDESFRCQLDSQLSISLFSSDSASLTYYCTISNSNNKEVKLSFQSEKEAEDYYNNLTAATIVDYYNQALLAMED